MSRTLLLLRHAKSSWDDPDLPDHDRPLAARGKRAAPAVGRALARTGPVPVYVLCSTAVRAKQTWAHVAEHLPGEIEVVYDQTVYRAGPSGLLEMIRRFPGRADPAMIVGHNPVMQTLARQLTRDDGSPDRLRLLRKFPTAALAEIGFIAEDWSEIEPGSGRLMRFVRPRDLDVEDG